MKRMIITASRFQKEIAGDFGDYWKRDALKRVDEYTKQADEEAVVEDDGAIKWKDSGNYLMDDFCEVLEYAGYDFSRPATRRKRDKQNAESLANYRKNKKPLSKEERDEMRAAFGNGQTVVDLLSGDRYRL